MAHVLVIQTVVEVIAKELTLRDSAAHPSALRRPGWSGTSLRLEAQTTPLSPSRRIDGERYLAKTDNIEIRTHSGRGEHLALHRATSVDCALDQEDADAGLAARKGNRRGNLSR